MLKKLLKKKVIIPLGLVICYLLSGFFLAPVIIEKVLPDKLNQAIDRPVTLGNVSVNPIVLSVCLNDFNVQGDKQDLFVKANKIYVNLSWLSVLTFSPVVDQILIENPTIHLVRYQDQTLNISDLIGGNEKEPSAEEELKEGRVPGFVLKDVQIISGQVLIDDQLKKVKHEIKELSFSLPFLSSKPKKQYEKAVADIGLILNNTSVTAHAKTTPFALDRYTMVELKILDMDLTHYAPYVEIPETVQLQTMKLGLNIRAAFKTAGEKKSLTIDGQVIGSDLMVTTNTAEKLVEIPGIEIQVAPSDVLASQIHLGKVLMKNPGLNLDRDTNGQLNLVRLFSCAGSACGSKQENKSKDPDSDASKKALKSQPMALAVDQFQINNGTLFFKDTATPQPFETTLSPLNISITDLTVAEKISALYEVRFETEKKEILELSGGVEAGPAGENPKLHGKLGLSDVLFAKYEPYFSSFVGLKITQGGLSVSSDYDIAVAEDTLTGMVKIPQCRISSFEIKEPDSSDRIFFLPDLTIQNSIVDIGEMAVNTGSVFMEKVALSLNRSKQGELNVSRFLKSPPPSKKSVKTSDKEEKAPSAKWAITLPELDAKKMQVQYQDFSCEDPVKINLNNIGVKAENISTTGQKPGRLDVGMTWNKAGKISLKGNVLPSQMTADIKLGIDKIDIMSLQPYFTDKVKVLVTNGDFHTHGKVNFDLKKEAPQMIRFRGKSSVTGLVALDKASGNDFLTFKSFFLDGLDLSLFPLKLVAKDIALTDFYSNVIVSKTGQVNLNSIFKDQPDKIIKEEQSSEETKSKGPWPDIRIDNVTLQGGDVQFSDYLAKPNFSASMKGLAGSVTGLSSDESSRATLHLKGLHGQSSPLEITGQINPLAPTRFVDIDISFKDIELTNFSPYATKYLGYNIEKGKLILDLEYLIKGSELKSENRVRFENFFLGDAVDSKDATSLPVKLAISLLKNSDGQIDLDLPVTGELGDPEFSFGGIVFEMLSNLILKVVTSPFSIIGAMFGGGEELEYVDFVNGEVQIDPSEIEKIEKIAQILRKKPDIKLEIQGIHDPVNDASALKIKGFNDLLKAEKIKTMTAKGVSGGQLETMTLSKEELPHYVELAYTNATFIKPRDQKGQEKQLSFEEKKKLLMTHVMIGEGDLRLLSLKRSENIKAYLSNQGLIKTERIFLLDPVETSTSDDQRFSRVKFSFK